MRGDFTRSTFSRKKHYSSVRLQQGRVHLDADTNEQTDIVSYRVETETQDVIGACGAPLDAAGFALSDGAVPLISEGRYYVDGILCENDTDIRLDAQEDRPGYTLETAPGRYLAYLDVWQRHLTALDDGRIRETALGGPDTATRTKTVWQVRLMQVATGTTCASASATPEWTKLTNPTLGSLRARAHQREQMDDLCSVEPGGGYRRLENQLYRVEIHDPGTLANGQATFKWSRENGSVVATWADQDGNTLIVSDPGRDQAHGFAAGQWVELSDSTLELEGKPGVLVQLSNVEGRHLTISLPAGSVQRADFPHNPKIRRWDSAGKLKVELPSAGDGYLSLEDGVEVKFGAGEYRTGDYWLIPARSARGTVEWEPDPADPTQPSEQPRHGVSHHYCRLAILDRDNTRFTVVEDCRTFFPAITELITLSYLGGDGQEMMPSAAGLPQLLRVGVARGSRPVPNATVRFVAERDGRLATTLSALATSTTVTVPVRTDANGVAECAWKLDSGAPILGSQHVIATLLDSSSNPAANAPIRFTANLSLAREVAYDPASCPDLAGVTNVQDAIDQICKREQGGRGCCETTIGKEGEFPTIEVALTDLLGRGQRDICLCLLPGEHTVSSGLPMLQEVSGRSVHIRIRGCGPSTRLVMTDTPWMLRQLGSFQMEQVAVHIDTQETALRLLGCREVSFRACVVRGTVGRGALIEISKAQRILLRDNDFSLAGGSDGFGPREFFRAFQPAAHLFQRDFQNDEEFRRAALGAAEEISRIPFEERHALLDRMAADLEAARADLDQDEAALYERFIQVAGAEDVDVQTVADLIEAFRRTSAAATGLALVVGDAEADTTLDNNRIFGVVSLYGEPGGADLNTDYLHLFRRQLIAGAISLDAGPGVLHAHDNHFARLVIGAKKLSEIRGMVEQQGGRIGDVYRTAFFSDNLFEAGNNQILADALSLGSNVFHPVDPPFLGIALARSATYIGNQAPDEYALVNATGTDVQAANLGIRIEDA